MTYSLYEPFIQSKIAEFSKEISLLCGEPIVFEAKRPEPVTPEFILNHVCERLNVDKNELLGRNRKRHNVDAGFICAALIKGLGYGSSKTGTFLKSKPLDHSTVIWRWRQHETLLVSNRAYRNKFESCKL